MMDKRDAWCLVLVILPVVAVVTIWGLFGPIHQPTFYHQFADQRAFLGIPHFANVVSNLAFLLTGGLGFHYCIRRRPLGALGAWAIFFAGFVLVSLGSGYYHANPNSETLVWDRLTMAVAFAGVHTALISEYVSARLERYVLVPVLVCALGSVLYWSVTSDLSFYYALQATVFLSAAVILSCFDSEYHQKRFILGAFAIYALALVCDFLDIQIFMAMGGVIGGHAIKHLFAAIAAYVVYWMLRRRMRESAS
jgi:hypothetical protein